ncbi:hypothetical protein [Corynebacterium sp. AOP12-C2-36]|uniref:hypothetical protein n=1 Tax=Corynebacterium sp. AOP12-C2-36 TaxID=3457723 RepID=UPI004034541C
MRQQTRTAEVVATLTYRTTKTVPEHVAANPVDASEFIRDQLTGDDLDSVSHLLGFELELSSVTSSIAPTVG